MERKGRLFCCILMALQISAGCSSPSRECGIEVVIINSSVTTKSELPDEELISDVNLFVFDSYGKPVYNMYSGYQGSYSINLLEGEPYSVHACMNFGYKITVSDREELENLNYHIAYPDEYKNGIPMYAHKEIVVDGHQTVMLEGVRLMSRISIRMDRSRLSKDIEMIVSSIKIGNCPKHVCIGKSSKADSEDDCFRNGFYHSGPECTPLNTEDFRRMSGELSLYMMENMQGRFSENAITDERHKVFEDYDSRSRICSYIEICMDYSSDIWQSGKTPLKYRFYLGEGPNSLDIERNCHYHITICPEDDGLREDGWRVDKTGLEYTGQVAMQQYPGDYINGNIGDKIHIGCLITPSWAPFDGGIEYMEADKAEGIYDYHMDPDGHGATLTLTGPGRGLIYMEAGAPVNDAALFVIEVNRP